MLLQFHHPPALIPNDFWLFAKNQIYSQLMKSHISEDMQRNMLTSMKGEINKNTIIVGDFNTPLTPMDRSTNRKLTRKHKL